MAKRTSKGRKAVSAAMHEQYHSRKKSVKARPRKQKIAIALSKARRKGYRV